MLLSFHCPSCQRRNTIDLQTHPDTLVCPECAWVRPVPAADRDQDPPQHCLLCGCGDVWRQKDFPQKLGVMMVAAGAILSTIAWAYWMPMLSIGILLGFALIDCLLYIFMPDVLVCYRCSAKYRRFKQDAETPSFNLETAERYRQEALRLRESAKAKG
jgi:hypothetical protein